MKSASNACAASFSRMRSSTCQSVSLTVRRRDLSVTISSEVRAGSANACSSESSWRTFFSASARVRFSLLISRIVILSINSPHETGTRGVPIPGWPAPDGINCSLDKPRERSGYVPASREIARSNCRRSGIQQHFNFLKQRFDDRVEIAEMPAVGIDDALLNCSNLLRADCAQALRERRNVTFRDMQRRLVPSNRPVERQHPVIGQDHG